MSVTAVGIVQVLVGGVAAAVGYVAWSYRGKPGGLPLVMMAGAAALYAVASATSASVSDPAAWQVFQGLLYPLTAAIGAGALYLGIDFTGRDIREYPTVVAVLLAQVAVGVGLAVTEPAHGLFIKAYTVSPAGLTTTAYGPGAWVNTLLSLIAILSSITLLTVELAGAEGIYREQTASIVVSGLFGVGFFLWEILEPIHPTFNLATVGIVGWCSVTLWGMFRFDLLEVSPVAAEALIDSIDAAVLALDTDGEVVDANAAARELLGVGTDDIGSPVEEALAEYPAVAAAIDGDESETEVTIAAEDRTVEIELAPVHRTHGRPGPVEDRQRLAGRTALIEDVTERKQRERRLERQNERLEEFASVVSHDLRNPLNVARGRVDLARTDAEGDTEHLDAVARAHERMETLIDDLLTLARTEGEVEETAPVRLDSVVKESWAHTDTAAATLSCTADRTIAADRSRLRQLFENLIRNAVEHGDDAVCVTVGDLPGDGDTVGFYVEDDGPGIPETERDRVFESGHSLSGGTGLGLAIVKRVVDDHGWEVRATESDDGGARFEVSGVEAVSA